jgi:hypothetical protein
MTSWMRLPLLSSALVSQAHPQNTVQRGVRNAISADRGLPVCEVLHAHFLRSGFLKALTFLLMVGTNLGASLSPAQPQSLTTQEFNAALAACALGLDINISANLIGSVTSIYEGERTKGAASLRMETKFLQLFPEADREKIYVLYVNCIEKLIPAVGQYAYLRYVQPGILYPMGWGSNVPDALINSQKEPLAIYPTGTGVWDPRISFTVSSSSSANIKVENLYLKLRSFAPCKRRDDKWKGTAGDETESSTAYFMSEDYDTYPIKPINNNLVTANWVYKGKDLNNFTVRLQSSPYVLYLFTVNIDYIDLHSNQKKHVETDQFSQIYMKDDKKSGNQGGCLNLDEWLSDSTKMNTPASKSYDDQIPYDVYQLLTADFTENPGLMNVFLNNRNLVQRKALVQSVVASRPKNPIFQLNYKMWVKALGNQK